MWMWPVGSVGWGWLTMVVMMALFWVPVLLLAAWGTRALLGLGARGGGGTAVEADARELARRGYARGEFTRERFMQIMEDLDRTEGVRR